MRDEYPWPPPDEDLQEQSEQRRPRGLSRFVPSFLRRGRAESTESPATDLAMQMGERPVEELDARLLALRERAQSRPQDDEPTPKQELYDVDEILTSPEILQRPGGVISPLALSKAQQEQVDLLREMAGGAEADLSGAGAQSVRGGLISLGTVPRMLISLLALAALALPFISDGIGGDALPPADFHEDRQGAFRAFNYLDRLTVGDYALVAMEYGPTAAGELDAMADVILRHIFTLGAKPIIVSGNPVALVHARNVIADIARSVAKVGTSLRENQDYYILRYLSGGPLGLRDLSRGFASVVKQSARGEPTGLTLISLDELALIALIAERAEDLRHWAEQVAVETDRPFIVATGYAAGPMARPYVDGLDAVLGMFVGARDVYTYGQKLEAIYAGYGLPTPIPITPTVEASPTATATVMATATVEASATATIEPSATPTVESSATPTEKPNPTEEPTPTEEPGPTEGPEEEIKAAAAPPAVPTETAAPELIPVANVVAQYDVRIRRRPNTASDIIRLAREGDSFPILGRNGDGSWVNILLPDGVEAWIAAFLVEESYVPEGSADADGRVILRVNYSLRLGKNGPLFYQAEAQTRGVRAEFVNLRERRGEEARLHAMTLGTIFAALVIVAGNLFYAMRALFRWRSSDGQGRSGLDG